MDEAKKGYIDYRNVNRSQDALVASHWVGLMQECQDWTEAKRNDEKVMKLTLDDVNKAFRKMVKRDGLTVVLAGDQKKANEQ